MRIRALAVGLGTALVAAACGGSDLASTDETPGAAPEVQATATEASPLEEAEMRTGERLESLFPGLDPALRTIGLDELLVGQVPDGIPAIDAPRFASSEVVSDWLDDSEPVVALEVNGVARAYPIQILIWHEIVNDVIADVPVAVTFCPLCNTAISFERTVDGSVRDFGTSGLLRRSDLVMYDRQNQSLWQQITGEAIVGSDVGTTLVFLPSALVSFGEFRAAHPEAEVLTRETGFPRDYGFNPYFGYDEIGSRTRFPVQEFDDARLDAKERVLTVEAGGEAVAFPFSALSEAVTIETEVAGEPVVAFWQPGAVSPLDDSFIVGSRNVGSAAAYSPFLDGEHLTFEARDGKIEDAGTGSTWDVLGRSTDGPLAGRTLEPVISANHFWFAWVVFQPETRVVTGAE